MIGLLTAGDRVTGVRARIGITLDTHSHVLPTMQHAAAEKLDQLIQLTRTHVAAEQARSEAAAAASQSDVAAQSRSQGRQRKRLATVRLQTAGNAVLRLRRPRGPESLEEREWSHLDLNQGPPACEEDQGVVRERPLSAYFVDFTRRSRRR